MSIPPICFPNNINLPNNIDIESPLLFQNYKVNGENEGKTDFMVMAEFSEIEGPVPLVIIPNNIEPFIEINELVLNLMSTDYQSRGSNEFRIWDCTSLTLLNHGLGQFICAQYFILYDIGARGFVRPMCIAYCSRSLQKILNFEGQLETEIWQAIEYLKMCNLKLFSHELKYRIKDLLYTKKRLLLTEKDTNLNEREPIAKNIASSKDKSNTVSSHCNAAGNIPCITESTPTLDLSGGSYGSVSLASIMFDDAKDQVDDTDDESILQHVTLDSLVTQITDCQNIFRIVSDYLESTPVKELEELKGRISSPNCALRRFYNSEEPTIMNRQYTPSVFAWSLMRRNYKDMRKIKDLCGIGYLACLLKLLNVMDIYSKPYTDLFFRELELRHGFIQSPVGTLQMGFFCCQTKFDNHLGKYSFVDDTYDGRLVQMLTTTDKSNNSSKNLIESYSSDVSDNVADLLEIVESKISLRCVQNGQSVQSLLPNYNYVSARLETNWHILWSRFDEAVKSILYSVLCGRTVVVAGPDSMEENVTAIIDILSSILPFRRELNFPVLRWHMGIVTNYHVNCYRIIGICIPERLHLHELMSNDTLNKVTVLNVATDRISGVAYTGKYLQTVNLVTRQHKAENGNILVNSCFQSFIQNTLMRLGRDGFLLAQMLAITTRSDDQILKGLGIHQGDWAAVKYISNLLRIVY